MEPLENRIARLPPEQQQEVSDFVDFLLLKNNLRQPLPVQPSLIMVNTPPVMVPDPLPQQPVPPVQATPLVAPDVAGSPPAPVILAEETVPVIHEITAGDDDRITRDYMDYGRFEPSPSPATDAGKKVRQKLGAKDIHEKDRHILDWV